MDGQGVLKVIEYTFKYMTLKEEPYWSRGSYGQTNNLKDVMHEK